MFNTVLDYKNIKESMLSISYKLVLLIFISIIAVTYKKIFFIVLFIVLDILNSYINSLYNISLPLDFLMIGVIVFSIKYSILSSFVFLPFILFNKILLGKFHKRLFIKLPITIFVAVICSFVSISTLKYVIFQVYLLRYAFEYLLYFVIFKEFDFEKIPRRVYNYLGMCIFFIVFSKIIFLIS